MNNTDKQDDVCINSKTNAFIFKQIWKPVERYKGINLKRKNVFTALDYSIFRGVVVILFREGVLF